MPATLRRPHPGIVRADCAFELLAQQFAPVHLGLGEVFDDSSKTAGHVASACLLRSSDHRLAQFVADLCLFFGTQFNRTALTVLTVLAIFAFTVALAFVVTVHVIVEQLVEQLADVDLVSFFVQLVIDLFRAHAIVLGIV